MRQEAGIVRQARWAAGCWQADAGRLVELAAGFSGSPVYRVALPAGRAGVLKRFATGTGRARAAWVHALVGHLREAGIAEIPAILPLPDGGTVLADPAGRLWEMTAFMPGASLAQPSPAQLVAALRLLARVHAAVATLPGQTPALGPSRGLATRIERARRLLDSPWADSRAVAGAATGELASLLGPRLLAAAERFATGHGERVLSWLAEFQPPALTCQVVLRDVSSDHVLFSAAASERVSGLIDLHAAGWDTPATDLARLLGSWLPLGPEVSPVWWTAARTAYAPEQPLSDRAAALVPLLAGSGILFGLDNWFRWVFIERRSFADTARVVARVDWLLARLPAALELMRRENLEAGW